MHLTILRPKDAWARLGVRRSTAYNRVKQGLLPPPVKIGERMSGWPEYEIDSINAALISGKSHDQIRGLVLQLLELRKQVGATKGSRVALLGVGIADDEIRALLAQLVETRNGIGGAA